MIATDGLELFASLGSLADLVGQSSDLNELLDRAASIIAEATGAELCVIAQPADDEDATVRALAASSAGADATDSAELASWLTPIVSRVHGTSQPLLIQTADASDDELRTMLSARGFASVVAASVTIEDEAPLVLAAFSSRANDFASAELGFMSSTTSILSLARGFDHHRNGRSDNNGTGTPTAPSESDPQPPRQTASLGEWELNLATGELLWSETAYRLFGLSPERTPPTQELFDSLVDPRDGERLRSSLRESRLSGQAGTIEYRITRADGATRWIRQVHELTTNGSGAPSMVGSIHDVTLQREASETMRRTDERLRAVLNVSEVGIAVVEDQGRTVYRNRAYTDLLGHSTEEMEHLRLEDLVIASDRARITALRTRLAAGETHVAVDEPVALVHQDGTVRHLAVSVRVTESDGEPFRVVNLRDMSAYVAAEREVAEGETRFESIFETASSGLLILGTDGLPRVANKAFHDIYGIEADALGERPIQDFIVSEQQALDVEQCIERHLRGEEGSCEHVLQIQREDDGQLRQVSVTCQTLISDEEIRGVLAEFTDLSELLTTQQALIDSERRLLKAEQVAGLGHWEWDVSSKTITASTQVTELLGSGADSGSFYERYTELLAPEDRDRVKAASEAAFAGEEPFDQQYTLIRPGAEPMIVHEVISVVFDDDGEPLRAFGTVQDVTTRVTAERTQAESESRLRAIFDSSHNGISFFSNRETPPFRNRAFAEMLGYAPTEIEQLPLGALLPLDEDRGWIRELWERVGQGEPAGDLGLKHFVRKDGHIVDVDIKISDVEVDGKVIGHVADVRDVTDELRSRRTLEESEARARLVFESASSGLLLMRLNGEIQLANQALCDIVGTTTDKVTELKVHRVIDRRDVGRVFQLFRARLNGQQSFPADVQVRLTRLDDGRVRTLRVEARPFIEDGEVAGMLADVRDITERVETQRELLESQDRLRRAQTNARVGGWELDVATNQLSWSDELYRLFGQEPGKIEPTIGSLLHGTHKEDRERFIEVFERAQESGDSFDIRMRFAGIDGIPRIIWSRGDLVRDEHGEPLRWEGTSQDITELAEAQEALAASEARLKAAQASAGIGSWSRAIQSGETSWSDELYRLLGTEPGSLESSRDNFRSFVHPDDVEAYTNVVTKDEELVDRYSAQARFVGADRVERVLRVSAELIRDDDDQPIRWDGTAQDVTEQAAAQEALTESEDRLNLAQSLAHVGSWGRHIVRDEGYWSDEFFRLLGYEPGTIEPSPHNFRKHIHPDDVDQFQAATDSAGDSYDAQVRFIGADDVTRALWMHGELTRDEDGNPLRWDGTGQDMTELSQAEQALAESTARLELAQSQAHIGSFGRDLKTDGAYWSDELYRLLGYQPGAIESSISNMYQAIHPDDRQRFSETVQGAVESGLDHYDLRSRFVLPDGEERVLWQYGELTRDQDGTPLRWDGTVQDLTELVFVQNALAEREEFLRTTLDAVRSGVMVVNPQRNIISANGNASQIMGYTAAEFLNVRLEDVVHDEDLALMLGRFAARVRGADGPEQTIVRAQRKDGAEISLDVRGAPLMQSGELGGVIVDFRDVTDELAVQHRLEDTAKRLRTLFETVRSGLMVVGPDLVPTTCNEALASVLGSTVDEVLSQSIDRFLLPEERQIVAESIEARMRDEDVPGRIPSAIIRTDGSRREVDVRSTPFVVDGKPIGILCEVRDITEDLALQEEVQDTAERLNNVFETVSTGLIIVGLDQRPLTVNQALCDILGYSRDELMQKTFQELTHPDDIEFLMDRFAHRISGGTATDRRASRAIRSDGAVIHVDISAEPFRIGGEIVGVLGEVRDITASLALQQEVENTAERLNTVFESVSTGLAIIGPDRRPITVNQALSDITGYSREELLARSFDQSIHPDDAEMLLERFADRMSGELDQRTEYQTRFIQKDGASRSISVSSEPFHIGGQFVGILAEIRDVTEERSLQRQVQETADRLNNVFESVSTGLLVIGPDRYPLTVNQALCDITGYSRDQLLNSPFDALIHGDDLPMVLERFAQRLAGDAKPFHLQARTIRLDGRTVTIDISAEPFGVGGEIVGVLAEIRDITEDLALQHRVQDSADRLNNVFESVSTGLAVIGPDRMPHTMNQAFCDILGRTEEDLSSEPFDRLLHPDDLQLILDRMARRLAGEEVIPHHINVRVIHSDGSLVDIDLSAGPFVVAGEIIGLLAEIRDVTEQLQLQHRVQDTADRLNNVFASASTGLAVVGPDRIPQTMNQAFCDILGRTEEDLASEPFDRLFHPDDLDLILERNARRLAGEEVVPHNITARIIRADGALIDVDVRADPFVVAGKTIGVLGEIRDITEELSLQSLVTESAEQINTILEATPDAIVVADDSNVILRVNAATEMIFGGGSEDLIGQSVSVLVGGTDRNPHSSYVDHYKSTGLPSTEEGLVIGNFREAIGQRLDGSEFPAELAVAETELSDGRKLFVAAIRDITERKQAAEQLQLLNTQLETRSRERQALVQQLLSAQEEERRTVAYEIHDGPAQQLAAAQMFLEAFAFDQNIELDDETGHFQRAKSYLDTGLTETRRIMSGLRPALLDDLGLADALHQLLNELTDRAGIQLELDSAGLKDDLSPALDITLYRIAQEAAGNALKHSGTDRLTVHLHSDGSNACLEITDHGVGFNPTTTQGPKDGRRFGLVGMRERVELLDGQFEIDSIEGRGTTIRATIPLNQERP